MVALKDLKKGDLFTLRDCSFMVDVPEHLIRVRGAFERISRKYSVIRYDDSCAETFMSGSRFVYPL